MRMQQTRFNRVERCYEIVEYTSDVRLSVRPQRNIICSKRLDLEAPTFANVRTLTR